MLFYHPLSPPWDGGDGEVVMIPLFGKEGFCKGDYNGFPNRIKRFKIAVKFIIIIGAMKIIHLY